MSGMRPRERMCECQWSNTTDAGRSHDSSYYIAYTIYTFLKLAKYLLWEYAILDGAYDGLWFWKTE